MSPFVSPSGVLAISTRGGDEEDRTPDPLLARQVLSQLSYTPTSFETFYSLFEDSLSGSSKLNNVR